MRTLEDRTIEQPRCHSYDYPPSPDIWDYQAYLEPANQGGTGLHQEYNLCINPAPRYTRDTYESPPPGILPEFGETQPCPQDRYSREYIRLISTSSDDTMAPKVAVQLGGRCNQFVVDTGATVNVMKEQNIHYRQKLHHHMRNVHFKTSSGDSIYFDAHGNPPVLYEIWNWKHFYPNAAESTKVGSFRLNPLGEPQLLINDSDIHWHQLFTQTPRSMCSESCAPGYRKVLLEQKPSCCYNCAFCPEGEITNATDMENCLKCPEDQWSNEKRNSCISRTTDFLSFEDPLGMTLSFIASSLSLLTAALLGIFTKYNNTPLVKANNRDLSYTLLLSLMLSFLCSFLFIGRPTTITCVLRQPAFGIIFTIAVSSVLAKTITVIIAFNAIKPGSKLRMWVDPRVSSCLVLLCSLVQVLICAVWLLHSAPFPDIDTKSETGKLFLRCNEGSLFAFYEVVGYMGFLALLSFVVASIARKLPNSFNESQLITFSMLVFCSVWISFIPAYLSTKGKYIVAVEIFAILTSSAGLLVCIFIPKCYVILLRPEQNTKEFLMRKHSTTRDI
ncbi:vomeronasal type-2 receptor 26-like [Ambystoma mexicanum]|uniref:vomeronasal type-2 receptor 26-like n=1 Tax=Ambystoma mexicanum TaxID=8296 RepID=UPI0037E85F2F